MDLQLSGRVAIVTGASRGLGKAAALALAQEGAHVLGTARTADALAQLESEGEGRIAGTRCDMLDLDAVAKLPDLVVERFGRLDIVVNNAGVAPAGAFVDHDAELWQRVLDVNVLAPAVLCRASAPYLLGQGSGKIINVASTSALLGKPTLVAYSASKGAMLQMTKALAAEWAKHGIQVNAIAPGAFKTDAQAVVLRSSEILARRLRKIPAGRMGDVSEIGPLVCMLSSPLSDFITGSVFVADGGESAKL